MDAPVSISSELRKAKRGAMTMIIYDDACFSVQKSKPMRRTKYTTIMLPLKI